MEKELNPTPHKEKMTCDGSGWLNEGPKEQCPGCPVCHPEKEKREDAGEDVCDPKNGNCAHCGNLGLANRICDNKCGCHSTPRPSQEAMDEAVRKAIRKIRKAPDVIFSSDPKVKSHEEKLVDLFLKLLDHAKAEERERLTKRDFLCDRGHKLSKYCITCYHKKRYADDPVFRKNKNERDKKRAAAHSALSLARKEDGK